MTVYSWHADVAASLLMPMGFFEVALRNAINSALAERYSHVRARHTTSEDKWPAEWIFLHGDWLWLSADSKKQLSDAISKVAEKNKKTPGFQVKPFHVVPLLKFQLWEDLLSEKYVDVLWVHSYWVAFPHAPVGPSVDVKTLMFELKRACQLIRETRNRVAHHEPMFAFDINQVLRHMENILDLACPDAAAVVRQVNQSVSNKWNNPPACFV